MKHIILGNGPAGVVAAEALGLGDREGEAAGLDVGAEPALPVAGGGDLEELWR